MTLSSKTASNVEISLSMIERDLAAIGATIAQSGMILSTGGIPDLVNLPQQLEQVGKMIGKLPAAQAKAVEPRMIALLDDTATLEKSLRQSLAWLEHRRQARDTHQQAAAAYRTPNGR